MFCINRTFYHLYYMKLEIKNSKNNDLYNQNIRLTYFEFYFYQLFSLCFIWKLMIILMNIWYFAVFFSKPSIYYLLKAEKIFLSEIYFKSNWSNLLISWKININFNFTKFVIWFFTDNSYYFKKRILLEINCEPENFDLILENVSLAQFNWHFSSVSWLVN